MANNLNTDEKHLLCLYKEVHPGLTVRNLIAQCEETFGKTPSKSQISRVLVDHKNGKRWDVNKVDTRIVKRVRASKWPELEKGLDLWIMQVELPTEELKQRDVLGILPDWLSPAP